MNLDLRELLPENDKKTMENYINLYSLLSIIVLSLTFQMIVGKKLPIRPNSAHFFMIL